MRLRVLAMGTRKVAAPISEGAEPGSLTSFESELGGLRRGNYEAAVKGLEVLFDAYAEGLQLTKNQFHEADKSKDIWEFKKGDLRVFCFKAERGLVVLSTAIVKKSQKADPQAVARAVQLRERYLKAAQTGNVKWEQT